MRDGEPIIGGGDPEKGEQRHRGAVEIFLYQRHRLVELAVITVPAEGAALAQEMCAYDRVDPGESQEHHERHGERLQHVTKTLDQVHSHREDADKPEQPQKAQEPHELHPGPVVLRTRTFGNDLDERPDPELHHPDENNEDVDDVNVHIFGGTPAPGPSLVLQVPAIRACLLRILTFFTYSVVQVLRRDRVVTMGGPVVTMMSRTTQIQQTANDLHHVDHHEHIVGVPPQRKVRVVSLARHNKDIQRHNQRLAVVEVLRLHKAQESPIPVRVYRRLTVRHNGVTRSPLLTVVVRLARVKHQGRGRQQGVLLFCIPTHDSQKRARAKEPTSNNTQRKHIFCH
mmetsp:Transcript_7878/g.21676  ORF Transcript_7878/g.21676 Transcript_7878/m.21676 type:complete len:341 (-) Transcript_7878:49-1071(-)